MKNQKKPEVWIFVEQNDGKIADVSLELLSKGRKLAESLNGMFKAIVMGHEVRSMAEATFQYGVKEVMLVDHPDLKHYRTLPYSRLINELILAHQPRIVLIGATYNGRDLAPRVASHTRCGLTADCTDLQISNVIFLRKEYKNLLLQIRPAFGGNIIAINTDPDAPIFGVSHYGIVGDAMDVIPKFIEAYKLKLR